MIFYTKSLFVLAVVCITLMVSCSPESRVEDLADERKEPSHWMLEQRLYPHMKLDYKALQTGRESMQSHEYLSRNPIFSDSWTNVGPNNIGGRITDIEMPDENMDLILAGSASGGIFKSEDRGETWRTVFDNQSSLSIGDLDIYNRDESIVYVGTGEANGGGGSLTYPGDGVYKSLDGGETWENVGLKNTAHIGKVVIHPSNPDIVYVAAMGRLFSPSEERGIFKTTDGGLSWERILYVDAETGGIDLVIHPDNPDTVFAAMWRRVRTVNNIDYGGATSDIYRSYDGGKEWKKLEQGLPTRASEKGRIALAVSRSQPERIYAQYSNRQGSQQGFYVSIDHGTSWDEMSSLGITNVPFMWWFGSIEVDPEDPENVYLMGLEMYQRNQETGNWRQIFQGVHVDQHALFIHPQDPQFLVLGNDGGIYISQNGGVNYRKVEDLPNIQFYTCEIDESDPTRYYGGSQDNGTLRNLSAGNEEWERISGGDGMTVLIDRIDNNVIYTMFQNGIILRSFDGGNSFVSGTNGLSGRFNWNTPLEMDPQDPSRLYTGSDRVYMSTYAEEWTPISPDLTNGPYQGNRNFGTLTSISVSPIDPDIIYAGTDDGNVWLTLDGGITWDRISQSLPSRWITDVEADPLDRQGAYVTLSGFRFGEDVGHVYYTDNYGDNWSDISGNLPDVPVNDALIHPSRNERYIATDLGVFYSTETKDDWKSLGVNLPVLPFTKLDYHEIEDFILAASYGRSMFVYELGQTVSTQDEKKESGLLVFPQPAPRGQELYVQSDEGISEIQLFALDGKRILRRSLHNQTKVVIDEKLLPGQYYLYITTGESVSGQKVLITP